MPCSASFRAIVIPFSFACSPARHVDGHREGARAGRRVDIERDVLCGRHEGLRIEDVPDLAQPGRPDVRACGPGRAGATGEPVPSGPLEALPPEQPATRAAAAASAAHPCRCRRTITVSSPSPAGRCRPQGACRHRSCPPSTSRPSRQSRRVPPRTPRGPRQERAARGRRPIARRRSERAPPTRTPRAGRPARARASPARRAGRRRPGRPSSRAVEAGDRPRSLLRLRPDVAVGGDDDDELDPEDRRSRPGVHGLPRDAVEPRQARRRRPVGAEPPRRSRPGRPPGAVRRCWAGAGPRRSPRTTTHRSPSARIVRMPPSSA